MAYYSNYLSKSPFHSGHKRPRPIRFSSTSRRFGGGSGSGGAMTRAMVIMSMMMLSSSIRTCSSFSSSSSSNQSLASTSLTPVQQTSLLVAYWRALETNNNNNVVPLIHDFQSARLVDQLVSSELTHAWSVSPIRDVGQDILAVRSKCIDDWLLLLRNDDDDDKATTTTISNSSKELQQQPQRRQVVNLGAGMCCRPYRLDFRHSPYERVVEVDSDVELLAVKRQALLSSKSSSSTTTTTTTTTIEVVDVQGDFSTPATLQSLEEDLVQSFGFGVHDDHDSPQQYPQTQLATDWIVEGVLEYLEPSQHAELLELTARLSPQGSRMALQVLEEPLRDYFTNDLGLRDSLPWQAMPSLEDFQTTATNAGWDIDRIISPGDWNQLYARDLSHVPGFHMAFLTLSEPPPPQQPTSE